VLQNSGLLKLSGGGDFKDSASITNFGTIEVAGGTLNVFVDITNGDATHSGHVNVDSGTTLSLSAGVVDGVTVGICRQFPDSPDRELVPQKLGCGGGDSPDMLYAKVRCLIHW